MIAVESLIKKFKDITAVNDVSFTVNNGEIVGLLGENGAGKTTILRIIATMLKPTAGTCKVNGFNILTDSKEVRSQIGILFGGEVGLYDRLTARENIKYFAKLNGMDNAEADKNIDNLIDMLEMSGYIDKRVGKFSRGMKQKVAIARSIVHRPNVMLFDEPTAGLDISAASLVQKFIKDCKKENKAIIFSSHSINEVEKLCDRIIIIHKGNLLENGTIDEIKKKYENEDLEEIFLTLVGDINV